MDIIDRLENSRGREHPDCVYGIWKLARLHELQGSTEQAIHACETALDRASRRLTNRHPMYENIESHLRVLRSRLLEKAEDPNAQDSEHEDPTERKFKTPHHTQTW